MLKCGNHRCFGGCHSGACLPCTREVRVACACGATSYRLPCGCATETNPRLTLNLCSSNEVCEQSLPDVTTMRSAMS